MSAKEHKLTLQQVNSLPLHEQAYLYMEEHRGESKKMPANPGMSFVAQANFWNDWQLALGEWKSKLPIGR